MLRVAPEEVEKLADKKGAGQMIHGGRPMKGYLFVEAEGYDSDTELGFWIQKCLDFNPFGKIEYKKEKVKKNNMQHISKTSLKFLKELKANNNRDWFQSNKSSYETAKGEFEAFVDNLIIQIAGFDPDIGHHSARDCIFRIYRDVRFSMDKSPYKTHLGAHITAAAKSLKYIQGLGIISTLARANLCWPGGRICRRDHGLRYPK